LLTVMKFGGTSVGSTEAFQRVADIVMGKKEDVVVVLSAMSGVTNKLVETLDRLEDITHVKRHECVDSRTSITDLLRIEERGLKKIEALAAFLEARHASVLQEAVNDPEIREEIARRIQAVLTRLKRILAGMLYLGEFTAKSRDLVLSFGERLSTVALEAVIRSRGRACKALRSGRAGGVTDSVCGSAAPLMKRTRGNLKKTLLPLLRNGCIPVITGYFGVDAEGNVTTLGRGGSDFSASIVGAALDADVVEIWTDVDGFYSADPRSVSEAFRIKTLSYGEAAELAYFGAKVLHPRTIDPLKKVGIPILIKNTFNPADSGSWIREAGRVRRKQDVRMRAVAAKDGLAIVKIRGDIAYQPFFSTRVYQVLDGMNLNVFAISTSLASFALLIEQKAVKGFLARLKRAPGLDYESVTVYEDVALICVVGQNIEEQEGVAARIFTSVADSGVNVRMIAEGASDVAVNFVVDGRQKDRVVTTIHDAYCRA